MAPKKTSTKTASPPPPPAPATEQPPAEVVLAPTVTKKPRAPSKPKAVKESVVPETTEAPKRNVSAVSIDFANTVKGALNFDINQKQVKEVCEAFLQVLVNKVKAGETVSFINNMTFKRQIRSGRTYKNLKTGETINKPKHFVLTMQVRPALKKVFDEIDVDAAAAPPQVSQ
jgi:nucleoid DNA-binding protein